MKRTRVFLAAGLILACGLPAGAQEKKREKAQERPPAESPKKAEPPAPEQSATQHSVVIGGVPINYTATAGTLILRNEKDEPRASVGYTAYTKRDVTDLSRRPITFAYNGGPGSSSIWLHMGALGPRRIVTTDAAANSSRPLPGRGQRGEPPRQDRPRPDRSCRDRVLAARSATPRRRTSGAWTRTSTPSHRFIKQYVSDNGRWNSPKYLLGRELRDDPVRGRRRLPADAREHGVQRRDPRVGRAGHRRRSFPWKGNDRPYALFLPTFAACAWYHKVLPSPPASLDALLDEVAPLRARPLHRRADEGGLPARRRAPGSGREAAPVHRALRRVRREGAISGSPRRSSPRSF